MFSAVKKQMEAINHASSRCCLQGAWHPQTAGPVYSSSRSAFCKCCIGPASDWTGSKTPVVFPQASGARPHMDANLSPSRALIPQAHTPVTVLHNTSTVLGPWTKVSAQVHHMSQVFEMQNSLPI